MTERTVSIIKAVYTATAVKIEQYPEGELAEIAFIGRSNVGKSSLINSLSRHRGLARVSGTPGKTQTINFYTLTAKYADETRKDFFLVDLPGYGYAKTGRGRSKQWSKFIEEFFLKSPRLKLVCQLIDIRHAPMDSDIETYNWLTRSGLPVQIIATKADKLSRMHIHRQADQIRKALKLSGKDVIPYSSEKGIGRDQLLEVIGEVIQDADSL